MDSFRSHELLDLSAADDDLIANAGSGQWELTLSPLAGASASKRSARSRGDADIATTPGGSILPEDRNRRKSYSLEKNLIANLSLHEKLMCIEKELDVTPKKRKSLGRSASTPRSSRKEEPAPDSTTKKSTPSRSKSVLRGAKTPARSASFSASSSSAAVLQSSSTDKPRVTSASARASDLLAQYKATIGTASAVSSQPSTSVSGPSNVKLRIENLKRSVAQLHQGTGTSSSSSSLEPQAPPPVHPVVSQQPATSTKHDPHSTPRSSEEEPSTSLPSSSTTSLRSLSFLKGPSTRSALSKPSSSDSPALSTTTTAAATTASSQSTDAKDLRSRIALIKAQTQRNGTSVKAELPSLATPPHTHTAATTSSSPPGRILRSHSKKSQEAEGKLTSNNADEDDTATAKTPHRNTTRRSAKKSSGKRRRNQESPGEKVEEEEEDRRRQSALRDIDVAVESGKKKSRRESNMATGGLASEPPTSEKKRRRRSARLGQNDQENSQNIFNKRLEW
eukprot:CAMPEP_0184664256 /NCGR_PEP_ID=MMETSP0308-20130426/51893_1 /TAXON_ID=38269 /ORGANISM="Gloeochaete witrockiana, Strain SAG 46.84" /LENGTH=506 /DNA_ID=CAMNT_0027107513 /DNA_START=8 /DNA_END=1525 /DNA_ORIENTATION=-